VSHEKLKEIREDSIDSKLPLEDYAGKIWAPILIGVTVGYIVLGAWGIREGHFPLSEVPAVLIPICITVYSLYLGWAWATLRWFFDKQKKGQTPADQLPFCTSGVVFAAHFVLETILIGIGIALLRSLQKNPAAFLAMILGSGNILDPVQRLSLLSELLLIVPILTVPAFAGVLSTSASLRYLREMGQIATVRQSWYNLSPKEKETRLQEHILPIILGERKLPRLRDRAFEVWAELRIEDIYDPGFEGEKLRKILAQLACLYYSESTGVQHHIQRIYITTRDRYMKRPGRSRSRAIVSLISLILNEAHPPYTNMDEVRAAVLKQNPELDQEAISRRGF